MLGGALSPSTRPLPAPQMRGQLLRGGGGGGGVVARPPSILQARGVPGRLRPRVAPRAAGGVVQLDPTLNARPRISIEELDDDDAEFLLSSGGGADGGARAAGGSSTGSTEDVSGAGDVATPLRPLKINQDLLIVSFSFMERARTLFPEAAAANAHTRPPSRPEPPPNKKQNSTAPAWPASRPPRPPTATSAAASSAPPRKASGAPCSSTRPTEGPMSF